MSGKPDLFGDDSDGEVKLAVNDSYANRYNDWRKKEELQKLKDRYGNDVDGLGSESESESESEEEWTAEHEKQFLVTLSALKSKHDSVFDANKRFFDAPSTAKATKAGVKQPETMYLKDYERKVMTEREGKFSDSSSEDEASDREGALVGSSGAVPGSLVAEEQILKQSLAAAVAANDGELSQPLLTKRTKTPQQQKQEDEDYLAWLAGRAQQGAALDAAAIEQLAGLKEHWNNPELDDGEKYLRDFILNRQYEEKNSTNEVPTYEQVVNFEPALEEDEEELDKQTTFEHKYNFRYEAPDQEFIKQYPRTIKDSVRREDTRRKEQRDSHKERKIKEKQQRKDDINRLKALKRAEINEKLNKLRDATGDKNIKFDAADLEGDFDPAQYDAQMQKLFTDEYYGAEVDEEKPVFSDLSDDDEGSVEDWDGWRPEEQATAPSTSKCAAAEPTPPDDGQDQPTSSGAVHNSSKSKKQSQLARALQQKKPVFDPSEKSFQEYYDEYYKLDCEDVLCGEPVRFKYRSVAANDYGLTADEILLAEDRELNAWASLNKMSQYRPENEEKYDLISWRKKAANVKKKQRLLPSVFKEAADEDSADEVNGAAAEPEPTKKNRRRKKKKTQAGPTETEPEGTAAEIVVTQEAASAEPGHSIEDVVSTEVKPVVGDDNKKRKRSKSNRRGGHETKKAKDDTELTDERLKAYGINPKKYRNKVKYGQKNGQAS